MKIALLYHAPSPGDRLQAVEQQLSALGMTVQTAPDDAAQADGYLRDCDVAVALGGDGTILQIAKRAAQYDTAVLGINAGHLGFMAGVEAHELARLSALRDGAYTVEQRMMLDVTVQGPAGERRFISLNEAVLARGSLSRMVDVSVRERNDLVARYRADGVLVATPTGSTAYSLSAGGPIVAPEVDCLLVTPLCPHSTAARSHVLRQDAVVKLSVKLPGNAEAFLTVDGRESCAIGENDTVTVQKSARKAGLIRLSESSFYDVLREKISREMKEQ